MKKHRGFTLIEIMIALVIFAIIGLLAALALHRSIRTNQHLNVQDKRLMHLQLAMTLIRRDLLQVINRPIVTASGDQGAAFSGESGQIAFTRAGLVNPLQLAHRTNMQRVAYQVKGDKLERLTWDVLDQAAQTKPQSRVLLDGVSGLSWSFVDTKAQTHQQWPSARLQATQIPLPTAVLLSLQVKDEGVIKGVFPVPAKGGVRADTDAQTTDKSST